MTAPRRHCYPDFIIAGAPRSATTWLYQLADRHPRIDMAKPMRPEPKFFLVDELYTRGLGYYARTWFDPLRADCVLGEKSTNYMESPVVAARIHECLPGVRLVFVLRNPVDRAYSNYLWSTKNGLEMETFERALVLEQQRERHLAPELRYARPFSYFSRGLYARHLESYFRLFPPDRILVLLQEDIATAPHSVAEKFMEFVGVTPMPGLADGLGIVNAAVPEGAPPMADETRAALAQRYRDPNRRLRELLGRDLTIWSQAEVSGLGAA